MAARRAWISFCACAGCELIAGQVYGFGLFSDVLRRQPGLDFGQASVEAVALSENFGQYGRLLGGLIYDSLGAKVTATLGLVFNSMGYLSVYLASTAPMRGGPQLSLAWLCAFAALYGAGAGWTETAAVATTVEAFPENRGEAAGLLKTFFGVASAVGSLAFAACLAPVKESMILALAVVPVVAGLPLVALIQPPPAANSEAEVPLVARIQQRSVASSSAEEEAAGEPWTHAYMLALALVALLASHSLLASLTPLLRPYEEHRGANLFALALVLALLASLPMLPYIASQKRRPGQKPAPPKPVADLTFLQSLCTSRWWLVFFALAAGEGAGIMVLNVMGQLVKALDHGKSGLQPVCVSFFSVSNAVGRLAMGRMASHTSLTKPQLLTLALLGTAGSDVLFALGGDTRALLVLPALGFFYGCHWCLQPLLASELFGLTSYGTKYAALALAPAAGGLPLCRLAVPYFYDMHADSDGWCEGSSCFRGSLLTAAGMCGLGAVLALWLQWSLNKSLHWQEVELASRSNADAQDRCNASGVDMDMENTESMESTESKESAGSVADSTESTDSMENAESAAHCKCI